ncbi:MAG: EAL domain-containing protein [Burkholderiales bacterium]|nr:EAL domain-containing protein [Burkholderiales bacterium]
MTLARQLFAGIFTAFIALLIGIEGIYVWSARSHLEEQLDAHANETATSLALSLGARAGTLDASLVNIMVNPVFDRGHFQSIEVRSPGGERVFGRKLEGGEIDVPGWFIALVPLQGPRGEALITAGWKQLGKVIVQVHPGYAYVQLYDTALATLIWLAVLFAIALLAVRHYLAGILKPLQEIEQTALAISNRNFISIAVEPRTRELQRVTHAMNSLSSKIRDAIAHESERAERLRKEAFEDPLTGRLNRRGFEQSVAAMLETSGEIHSGALALFFVTGLEEVNRVFGLSSGDDILKHLADALAEPGSQVPAIVGRWQGPTLAAFMPNIEAKAAQAWADGLCRDFSTRLREQGMAENVVLSSGITHFREDTVTLARIAQAAEGALAGAIKKGGALMDPLQSGARASDVDLKSEIESAIAANRITLLGQKVMSLPDRAILQMELLSSLSGGDGQAIPAGTFVPIASQHGLLASLDRKVVEHAVAALERIKSLPGTVSVNISMQSIGDNGFRSALRDLLLKKKAISGRLVFEITGYAASRLPDLTKAFSNELRRLGARVALDNFDLDRNSMAIAHELLPTYIKLAPAFTQQIAVRDDLRFIVEAMVRMLQPLEIPLIAQGVEDASTIGILAELGLSAYQGYAGGRPEPLPKS